jgi:hypothetical protein
MIFLYFVTHFTCSNAFPENNLQTPQVVVRLENAPTRGGRWLHLPTESCAAARFVSRLQHLSQRLTRLLKKSKGRVATGSVLVSVVPVYQLFLLLIGALPVWTDTTKRNHPTRKQQALRPFETSVTAQPATQHHIPEDLNLQLVLDQ